MTETPWLAVAPPRLKPSLKFICFFAVGFAAFPANALQQPANQTPETITVSALRTPTAFSEVGSSVSVITEQDIADRQYAYITDALRDAAGVAIARNGGVGGVSSARIRGAASGQTLVVIDGVAVNDPSAPQGGFNFANLDAADIERIEILRGPQSLLYGADAIGGVIVIMTKRSGTSGLLEGGSFGTARANASIAAQNNSAFGRLSVTASHTDGISRADGGAEKDGFRSLAASAFGGFVFNDNWRSEFTIRASTSEADIDGFPAPDFTLADTLDTEDTQDLLLAGKLLQSFERFEGALNISYNLIDRENRNNDVSTFTATGSRLTLDYLGAFTVNETWRVIAGAEAERTAADVSGVDETAKAGAAFVVVEVKPLTKVTLSAGARRDEFSNFEGATTTRFAGVWNAPHGVNIRASWGEGFRAPSLFELNFDQFGVIPNPDLRPERASGFDVGFEKQFGSEAQHRFGGTYFRTKVRDQIDFDSAGNGYFNIDETRTRGVEVEGAFALGPQMSVDLNYSYTDAIDVATGLQLLRQPKHKGTVIVNLTPTDHLSLSASAVFNGDERDSPSLNDGFIRLDVRAAFAVTETLEIYGRVENATDTDYQDISGYGEAGAAAYGGVRVRL